MNGAWRALWLTMRGRRDVPADGVAISYGKDVRPLLWILVGLGPVELAAAHPHTLDAARLLVRWGTALRVEVPSELVESIGWSYRAEVDAAAAGLATRTGADVSTESPTVQRRSPRSPR